MGTREKKRDQGPGRFRLHWRGEANEETEAAETERGGERAGPARELCTCHATGVGRKELSGSRQVDDQTAAHAVPVLCCSVHYSVIYAVQHTLRSDAGG